MTMGVDPAELRAIQVCMDTSAKKPRGRPKLNWEPFETELFRRLKLGLALETVQAEARWLAEWGAKSGLQVDGSKPLQLERIRERIKKRHGGTQGYKSARSFLLQELERQSRDKREAE